MKTTVIILTAVLIAFIFIGGDHLNDLKKKHLKETVHLLNENLRLKGEVREKRSELELIEAFYLAELDTIRMKEVVRKDSIIKYYEKNRNRLLRINADSTLQLFSERFRQH